MSKVISKIVVPDSSELTGYALYNVKDANAIPASEKGAASGVATLDNTGKIPSSQIPSGIISLLSDWNQTDSTAGDYIKNKPTSMPASDVSAWAKASSKPSYTKDEIGLSNVTNDAQVKRSEMGVASGVATLDSAGKVPSSQLPSYVDDVVEYDTKLAFPATGEGGKIYIDKSNDTSWRWSGSTYTQIKGDLTIGTTSGTAADGKIVNDHINNTSNPHSVTKAQVGLGSVVNTGDSATPVSGGTTKFTTGGAYTELAKKVDKVTGKGLSTNDYTTDEKNKLGGIEAGAQKHIAPTAAEVKSALGTGSGTSKYLREDGTWQTPAGQNYSAGDGIDITGNEISADNTIARTADLANEKQGNGIGTCSTSSGTALTVSLTGYELVQNGFVAVTFTNDVPASATLNVNNKGAKPIYYKGAAIEADVIKADDTVMFCYNGSQYVVTSLGGGGGTGPVVWPEFVTISLTQSGGSDSDLIGATVVVTNDDTSATILSTTWQGSAIILQVDAGVDYTVTVGDVSGLAIRQHTQSYTAESGLSRIIEFNYSGNAVDMGLPSGILWARTNIDVSRPSGFAASEFQYNCSYFSWGNIESHNPISTSEFDYSFSQANYNSTSGAALTGNIPANATYDIARAFCGGAWRLPTTDEFSELINGCDFVQADGTTVITGTNKLVTINGIVGIYLKSKSNGNHLFFSCSGQGSGNSLVDYTSIGYYWSATLASNSSIGICMSLWRNGVSPNDVGYNRYIGNNGRAVM